MKKNLLFLFMAMLALGFVACKDDNGNGNGEGNRKAPIVEWKENPDFDTLDIKANMSAVIDITAEAGIKSFFLKITSPALNDLLLGTVGLSSETDLTTLELDENQAAILKGIPFGAQVKNQTAVKFDASALVPLILSLPNNEGYHVFAIEVVDNDNQSTKRALVFHYVKQEIEVTAVDLWQNTATVSVKNGTETMKVQYRRQGTETWQDATRNDNGTYAIATAWEQKKNEAGLDVWVPDTQKGFWAGATYEYQLLDGTAVAAKGTFDNKAGDAIPNGDMSAWRDEKNDKGASMGQSPNVENDTTWASGNNTMANNLCVEDKEKGCAKLASTKALNIVFASGNLFTGTFTMETVTGTAAFGKKFEYTARPSALQVRYHATVGNVDEKPYSGEPKIAVGQPDTAVIYACIIDWEARHGVKSGMGTPSGMWNPVTLDGLAANEKVIAYGMYEITESTAGTELVNLTIPLNFYDKEALAPTGNYTLVIACANSKYGDYLNGCKSNVMYVDDFQWVY